MSVSVIVCVTCVWLCVSVSVFVQLRAHSEFLDSTVHTFRTQLLKMKVVRYHLCVVVCACVCDCVCATVCVCVCVCVWLWLWL